MAIIVSNERQQYVNKLYDWVAYIADELSFSPHYTSFDNLSANQALQHILAVLFPEATCTRVTFTMNYDKVPFYLVVDPSLSNEFLLNTIYDYDESLPVDTYQVKRYEIEFDSKLFSEFNTSQITEIILYNIYQVLDIKLIEKIRRGIQASLVNSLNISPSEKFIRMQEVRNEAYLFQYAIAMYVHQLTSIGNLPFNDPADLDNYYNMHELDGLQVFASVVSQVCGKINADIIDQSQHPAVQILDWLLGVYLEPELHSNDIINTLKQAENFTASKIIQNHIKRTLDSIVNDTHKAMVKNIRLQESLNTLNEGFSLFKSLKMNGLRTIEDDLYEYRIRIKNCEEEDEGMYILRQINTRMAILDDYIRNTDLSQRELDRWNSVLDSYRNLRVELGKKKLGPKKQYGIFIDYDKIDQIE